MGSALDAIAAERFIARVSLAEEAATKLSLTGYHLLPVASQRAELFPAIVLKLWIGSDDAAAALTILESVCLVTLQDECSFELVRLGTRSRPPDFAPRAVIADISASVAGTAVHLQVELQVQVVGQMPAPSQPYPSVLSKEHGFRVPCQSLAAYTADLMTRIELSSGLDADVGSHFQLAYLVRRHWSKISVAADAEYVALRVALQGKSKVPLAQILESQRQVWAFAASDERLAQRWSGYLGFRGFGRMLELDPSKGEEPSSRRTRKPAPAPVELSVVAEEIDQFLYRVG